MSYDYAPLIKAIDGYIKLADDDLSAELEAAGFIEPKKTVRRISRMERRIAKALKGEAEHFIDSFYEIADLETYAEEIWPDVVYSDDLDEKLAGIFFEEFDSFMPEFANSYMTRIDHELVVEQITQRTTAWMHSWSEKLGEIMQLNSHKELERIITNSLETGRSIAETTRAIQESGIRWQYHRARTVAVTETLRAHSYAHEEAIRQSPAVDRKEWVHSGSHKNEPRENHVAMSGKIVRKTEPFQLIGADGMVYYPDFPRDSNLPVGEVANCHCIHRGIVDDGILGLTYEERRVLQAQLIAEDDGAWEIELDAKNRAKAGIEI